MQKIFKKFWEIYFVITINIVRAKNYLPLKFSEQKCVKAQQCRALHRYGWAILRTVLPCHLDTFPLPCRGSKF